MPDAADAQRIMRMARRAVRKRLPLSLEGYFDDVLGETLLGIVEARHKGIPTSHQVTRIAVASALRNTFGDSRYRQAETEQLTHDGAVDAVIAATQERRALCLRRLQTHYATLTDQQQAAVLSILTEEPLTEVAARMGTTVGSLSVARGTAINRLANPSAYTRKAKERDKVQNARDRQKRYKARKKLLEGAIQ